MSASDAGADGGGDFRVAAFASVLGPRRLVFELAKRDVRPLPSESAVYRGLLRAGLVDPALRDGRSRRWKRWERGLRWSYGRWILSAGSRWPTAP